MYTNVNLAAPIGALAFLATGFILLVAASCLLQSLLVRKLGRAKNVLLGITTVLVTYFSIMLGFSFSSRNKLLARGEEKHFCELDCHLAYSVVNAVQSQTFGEGASIAEARGQFTVITIKTRFDETTIAPWRGNGWLYPNGRAFVLLDDRGHRYQPAIEAGTAATTPLRPGESYMTEVVFDLPRDMKPAALLVNESGWETHWLIGHENSLLHGQTKFQV